MRRCDIPDYLDINNKKMNDRRKQLEKSRLTDIFYVRKVNAGRRHHTDFSDVIYKIKEQRNV